jgi:hypothetical protein
MDELAGAEPVNVNPRKPGLDVRQKLQIPVEGELRMMPPLHQDLRPAEGDRFLDLPIHFLMRDDMGVLVGLTAVERAKLAIDIADVGVIDVPIDNVSDDLVAASLMRVRLSKLPPLIRQRTQLLQWEAIQPHRLLRLNPRPAQDPALQFIGRSIASHAVSLPDPA